MDTDSQPRGRGRIRHTLRRVTRWGCLGCLLLGLVFLLWFCGAMYHHWIGFPRDVRAVAAMRAAREPICSPGPWREFRGVMHSHSEMSHDCEVPFPEILRALQDSGRDFICMSDHPDRGRADFGAQWRGLHGGKLFIAGFEMRKGWMPFGVRPGVVLSNSMDDDTLARQIVDGGGLLFFAHPENPRAWDRPELVGMEIYNAHADAKDQVGGLALLLPDLLLNYRRYPEQVLRLLFSRPVSNLRRWDELNRLRPIVGIAGNDIHQNAGFRITCSPEGALLVGATSPKIPPKELRLNPLTRYAARQAFGPLVPNRLLLQVQLAPYPLMARLVGTHVFARELTEPAVMDALRAGRAFVGFDLLADSTGFLWVAETAGERAFMGEALPFSRAVRLRAASPLPCRFTVICDGAPVHRATGRQMAWAPPVPGSYRVEAELDICGEWTPWVYANPIRLVPPTTP